MTALLFATLLSLPIYPLNPVLEDTVNNVNLHLTAGFNGPGSVVSTGPELTVKYEWMVHHPFIVRAAFDYRYGTVRSVVYPDGDLHRGQLSLEVLYYRGTKKLMGYIGAGAVYSLNKFSLADTDTDSLYTNYEITDVNISNVPGYRITVGLRIHSVYSIEIGLTDTRPSYVYTRQYSPTRFGISSKQFRSNDFRISFGYLFHLSL
ncbi:MAG: hypothetical protein JSV52_11200 [Candidatus Zixiibacteriota bacterium]|nr:MAG: hypothetical protein JSV52_11200 [candidate division Zixibacteria bacterium]